MNWLKRLQSLPWLPLFQNAILATGVATLVDIALITGAQQDAVRQVLLLLFAPPLGILMFLLVSMGIAALAVRLLELLNPRLLITTGVLWAMVLCLVVTIYLKSLLPVPMLFVNADQASLLGLVLGTFLGGWRHWRRY
jgi:hypothetical protein